MSPRDLDVVFEVWRFLGQLQEIHAIQTQGLDRRTASNSGGAGAGFGEGRFAEAVTWFHRREGDFLAVLIGFHDSRPTGYEDIKRIRRIPLPNENVTEFVAFLLQERTELFEMFVGQKLEKRRTPEQVYVGRFHFARQAEYATECIAWSGPKNDDRESVGRLVL